MNDQEQTLGGAGGASGTAVWPYALPQDDPRHGTYSGYNYWRCRCDECRAASRTHHHDVCPGCGGTKQSVSRLCRSCWETEVESPHGTASRYTNQGCRCDECRQAMAEQHLAYMHRTGRAKPLAEHRLAIRAEAEARDNHGTETRYNNGGCRCRECRDAVAFARRLRRQRATTTAGRSPA